MHIDRESIVSGSESGKATASFDSFRVHNLPLASGFD